MPLGSAAVVMARDGKAVVRVKAALVVRAGEPESVREP
jgi:hypothetical protein